MKFRPKNNYVYKRTILVVSDLHLGAGAYLSGKRNFLEDFHRNDELIEFINYHRTGEFEDQEVEIIFNGDFLDLLAVPYVHFFDDEFWSETACLEKLKMIVSGHTNVFNAMREFCLLPKKKMTYIIGNHDAEMILPKLQTYLTDFMGEGCRDTFKIIEDVNFYNPATGVYIQHGQQYERPHIFSVEKNIITSAHGERYFVPPWGSYYVTQVINKYKVERPHISEVKPVKTFLIHGLIYDLFFTLRFIFANSYYFFMVKFWQYFMQKQSWKSLIDKIFSELEVFRDYESLTRDFFQRHEDARVLVVGHTHQAALRNYNDGTTFINTGTWTKIINLDLSKLRQGHFLTFAKISLIENEFSIEQFDKMVHLQLNQWKGFSDRPYEEFY